MQRITIPTGGSLSIAFDVEDSLGGGFDLSGWSPNWQAKHIDTGTIIDNASVEKDGSTINVNVPSSAMTLSGPWYHSMKIRNGSLEHEVFNGLIDVGL